MLAALVDLKARLGVTDTTQDIALTSLLNACTNKILKICRYVEHDTIGYTETHRNVRQSREQTTDLRPIKTDVNPFAAQGRSYGSEWLPMTLDLLDAIEGVFWVLGAFNWWPLTYTQQRSGQMSRRWRDPVWPIVQLTYDVTGIGDSTTCPAELTEATLALAIHWLGQEVAGASDEIGMGQLRQKINRDPIPPHVRAMLADHYSSTGARWVP